MRARLVVAAIFRKRGHHDDAIAMLSAVVARYHGDPLVELACDLWLDSLVRMHYFDRALELSDTFAADPRFLADKPRLARNIAFLRSRSLR